MTYASKPYKTFETLDGKIISVGDVVQFDSTDGEKNEGLLVNATAKSIEIIREETDLFAEVWSLLNIVEGTMKKI